ncbi:phosphotransferase [Dermabacteraceae bacterium P13077]
MRRSVYALAALVTAALDRVLPASAVLLSRGDSEEVDTAGVIDTEGRRWVVRAPRTAGAGIRTEAESRIAQALAKSNIGQLIAQPEASLSYGDARATVYPALPGRPLDLAEVEESEALARALGHAIGLIHSVPIYMAQGSGIPEMSAHELCERARRAVSRAGESRHLPRIVEDHFKNQLADDSLWQFEPCLTHRDLSPYALLVDGQRVSGISDWAEAEIGDPAYDLHWLVSQLPQESLDAVLSAYTLVAQQRATAQPGPDPRLLERAQLHSELAIVSWLLHGLDSDDAEVIADADDMLAVLEDNLVTLAQEEAEVAYENLSDWGERKN